MDYLIGQDFKDPLEPYLILSKRAVSQECGKSLISDRLAVLW